MLEHSWSRGLSGCVVAGVAERVCVAGVPVVTVVAVKLSEHVEQLQLLVSLASDKMKGRGMERPGEGEELEHSLLGLVEVLFDVVSQWVAIQCSQCCVESGTAEQCDQVVE